MISIKTVLLRIRRLLTTGFAALAMLTSVQTAHAASNYLTTWNNLYNPPQSGNGAGCQVCHAASTQNLNPYGAAFCNASGGTTARIQAAENPDSDNDPTNTNNIGEINANAQPGWTTTAVPTFTRGNCSPRGINENAPGNITGDLDPVNDPNIAVAPTNLNFGTVNVGNNNTVSTTIQNTGTATLTVSALNLSGSNEFSLANNTPNTPFNVGAGNSQNITVVYTPANSGTDNGSLAINSNDPDQPTVNVSLTGTGNVPVPNACNFAVAPTTLAFGNVQTGTNTTLSTTVTNNGTAACSMTVGVSSVSGQFSLASNVSFNVAPGGSSNVVVRFAPLNTGGDSATLNLASDDANNPQSSNVALTGNGVAPPPPNACNFTATPTTLSFGNVNTGSSATRTTTVSNNGSASCSIAATVASATGQFTLATGSTVNVAPGGSANVSVDFAPVAAGADSGSLNLNSSDANNPQNVNVSLTGTGVDNVPPPVGNCEGLDIDRASWSNRRDRLRVEGDQGQRDAGDFVLLNAYSMEVLATGGSEEDDRQFDFRVRNLDPVPCVVRVEQPGSGRCDIREVSNAPADCAPAEPPAANLPPVSDPNGPYVGNAGEPVQFDGSGSSDPDGSIVAYDWDFGDGNSGTGVNPTYSYAAAGLYTVSLTVTDNAGATDTATTTAVIDDQPQVGGVTARGDVYATPVGNTLTIKASRVSGVLYNDFGGEGALTAQLVSGPSAGSLDAFGADGSFTYRPGSTMTDNQIDTFTYIAIDANGVESDPATVVLQTLSKQTDFKILMNYELGMHCTGFEFAYCCVLPPYNSIIAQVVKPAQNDPACAQDEDNCRNFFDGYPRMLEGDPNVGLDGLNRQTVVRDWDYTNDSFKKYQLRYYHDAQPRQEGNTSKPNTSTLISNAEGNSLQYFNTVFDSAAPDGGNALVYGDYNGYSNVVQGDGSFGGPTDNYANGWLNHFYIYGNLEGHDNTGLEADKVRLGVAGQVEYPPNSGAGLQPLGPTGNGAFENVLTFSADTGTVVFTQAKVLEDLPIMLTSPRIWEALGLPLTPFEDTIGFFGDPGAVDEDTVRPFVAMKASLHEYPSGNAVTGSNGQPVIGFGTAPIDIPNCERCHSAPSVDPDTGLPNVNSPNWNRSDVSYPHGGPLAGTGLEDLTNLESNFWMAYYDIVPGVDSTWYPRLKGAAINMLTLHDYDVGTSFTVNYAGTECVDPDDCVGGPLTNESNIPQNTRLGAESVICQRCHADNVIANVKSATFDAAGQFPIPPITEAIHNQHRNKSEGGVIVFNDSLGRDGGCQGCHPAHRSDGVMDDYPITLGGNNANADGDNRLNLGGCFVGRDVHSNPMKDVDGAETRTHLNAIGGWLADNVTHDQGDPRGIWCTNCHTQLGQELWRTEDCNDLIRGDCLVNPRAETTLAGVAAAIGQSLETVESWLDPKVDGSTPDGIDHTHRIWDPATPDANVATIEIDAGGNPVVTTDADGDISVNILSFCTTDDCVNRINNNKGNQGAWRYPANAFIDPVNNSAAAVPFNAATDGRDHWLSAGEPHCADCHAAPYVEQSGNVTPYPPFNYPAKASLMRYTRGHQDISCQGCHESIHGLYPVTPTVDTTSYAQAAALNNDGSHGPIKCEACHSFVDGEGIPNWVDNLRYNDPTTPGNDNLPVAGNFDRAVSWMHTYTDEANPVQDVCRNCHGSEVPEIDDDEYLEHAMTNRVSRVAMDNAERAVNNGDVFGERNGELDFNQLDRLCSQCHDDELGEQECDRDWRQHLIEGRVAPSVWEKLSAPLGGCGW